MLFAHWAALLRVKWDGKQSAVNPVREGTWTEGEQVSKLRNTSAIMTRTF